MTKRAGRRKHRNGTQRHPPGPTKREPTIERDDLPTKESLQLEIRALGSSWIVDGDDFDKYRAALLKKVTMVGLSGDTDPKIAVQALRTVALVELKQKQLELQALGLQLRALSGPASELPQQVGTTNNIQVNVAPQPPTHEVIANLIARKDVRQALDRRSDVTAQLSDNRDRGADSEGPSS